MAATEELLGRLHEAVADDLLRKVESGEATIQEITAAIKFLKDNGIEVADVEDSPLDDLAKSLPDFTSTEGGLHGSRH